MALKILVVDDEELIRWSLAEDLKSSGYGVSVAEDVKEALQSVEKDPPDLVLTDLRLGAGSGLDGEGYRCKLDGVPEHADSDE